MEPMVLQVEVNDKGQISVRTNVADRLIVRGMLESARVALEKKWEKDEAGPRVEPAPPGLILTPAK